MCDLCSGIHNPISDLMKNGDYEKAIQKLEEVLINTKEQQCRLKAMVNRGICLYNLQRAFEANSIFNEIISIDNFHFEKGIAYFYLGKYLESIYSFCLDNRNDSDNYTRIGQGFLEFSKLLDNLKETKMDVNYESNSHFYWIPMGKYVNYQMDYSKLGDNECGKDLKSLRAYFADYSLESLEKLIFTSRNLGVKYLEKGRHKLNENLLEKSIEACNISKPLSIFLLNKLIEAEICKRNIESLQVKIKIFLEDINGNESEDRKLTDERLEKDLNKIVDKVRGLNENVDKIKESINVVDLLTNGVNLLTANIHDSWNKQQGNSCSKSPFKDFEDTSKIKSSVENLKIKNDELIKIIFSIKNKYSHLTLPSIKYSCWGSICNEKITHLTNEIEEKLLPSILEEIESISKEISDIKIELTRRSINGSINNNGIQVIDESCKKDITLLSTIFYNLGVVLFDLERYNDAINAFDSAIFLATGSSSSYARAFNNKGNALTKLKSTSEEAIKAYSEAIEKNKDYSIAYNNRGRVYFDRKNYNEASRDFDEAINCNSLNYEAWTNKGINLFEQGKYGEAKKALEKALELKPDYALANTHLGKLLFYFGDFNGADEKIDKALDHDVKSSLSWRLKGQILVEKGKFQDAAESFENAVRYSTCDASLVLWKAYANYLYASHLESNISQESIQTKGSSNEKNGGKLSDNTDQKGNMKDSNNLNPVGELNSKEIYSSVIRELEMYLCIVEERDKSLHKKIVTKK